MKLQPLAIPGLVLITPKRFGDHRGYFSEIFKAQWFRENVEDVTFVQDNHSLSRPAGTIRGLHFQAPGYVQGKLRATRGSIYDVAVDIRVGSPTYGQHAGAVLSADNGDQLWVPPGFAHGFVTLEPDTEIAYKVTDIYSPEDDRGLAFDDPALGIDWHTDLATATLSPRDRTHPLLADLPAWFAYEAARQPPGA